MANDNEKKRGLREWLRFFGSPDILFFALPWLMILLTIGTVAQRELGLYKAQEIFFSSWIFWLGPLPLPGTYATLTLITVCLLIKFLFFSAWNIRQSGIILTHLGVLVLLIGGIITALSQREGYIALREGQEGNAVSRYHDRVLTVEKDGEFWAAIPHEELSKQDVLPLPFKAAIESVCRNCRPAPAKNTQGRKGLAEQIELREAEAEKEDESNLSGLTLSLSGLQDDQDGRYVLMEEIPHRPEIDFEGHVYAFSMGRAQHALPFSIELKDFQREMHPGTNMARGFSSDVIVRDSDVSWPYTIRMNEPLRYKGYTFYQSSFSIRPDGEYSILSAVENKGRVFPYLASAIIFTGLLLHVIIRLRGAKGSAA